MAITHSTIPVSEDTAGTLRQIDTVTMAGGERRQGFVIAEPDSAGTDAIAKVRNVDASATDYGLVVRPVSTGTTLQHRLLTNSNNALTISISPARLFGVHVWNDSSSKFFVKVYNKASTPAPATDSGILLFVFGVQAGTHRDISFANIGANFTTGIGLAVVTGISDTDNTSVAANSGTVDVEWKVT
jgi:hypothetical protein